MAAAFGRRHDGTFPVSCGGCGQPLSHRPQYLLCQLCQDALADNPESEGGRLISGIPYYAPYLYGGPVEDMIWASKFRGRIDLSRQLGHLLMDAPHTASMIAKSDLLVPVPLSPIRGFQRGFNQSFEIARVLADRGQRPIHRGWRRKTPTCSTQTESRGEAHEPSGSLSEAQRC